MKLVFLSDTHEFDLTKLNIPDGDILIHSGDATALGSIRSFIQFNHQLGTLPHKHKIFVPGNHDWLFERDPGLARILLSNAKVLINEEIIIDGVRFYGSPASPAFGHWAFNYNPGHDIQRIWNKIPEGIDVLITHAPPWGFLDYLKWDGHVGCRDLLQAIKVIKPKVHAFGHIHEGYGQIENGPFGIHVINSSVCNGNYEPVNRPIEVIL